jgi:hypothetical protein
MVEMNNFHPIRIVQQCIQDVKKCHTITTPAYAQQLYYNYKDELKLHTVIYAVGHTSGEFGKIPHRFSRDLWTRWESECTAYLFKEIYECLNIRKFVHTLITPCGSVVVLAPTNNKVAAP